MDLTNRILIIGGALLAIFAVVVVILLTWGAPDRSITELADLAVYLDDNNDTGTQLIITFGGLILVLLASIIVIVEVAPPNGGSLNVANVGTGDASIPTDEVAHLLEAELGEMPQLSQVQAKVQARGDQAEVTLDLHVGAEADLATTAEEACRRAGELLGQRIGVTLARPPRAHLHYRELRVAGAKAKPAPVSGNNPTMASASTSSETPSTESPTTVSGPASSETPSTDKSQDAAESTHEATETSKEDRPAGV